MLVLTRKANESLLLGTDQELGLGTGVKIKVCKVRGDRVTIGIDAVPECVVMREEKLRDRVAGPQS